MNNDEMRPDETESLLKEVAPYLSATKAPALQPPPHVVARFKKFLAAKFPRAQVLSEQDMKTRILKLLRRQPDLTGGEIVSALGEDRLTLKDPGALHIFRLVWGLEKSKLLTSIPTETGNRKYTITDNGRAQLERAVAQSPQLSKPCDGTIQTTE